MSRVTVREKDRGAAKVLEALRGLKRQVTVGIHAAEGGTPSTGGDLTVAEVGAIHEFGLGVPQRSFLRAFADENRQELLRMLSASTREVASGKLTTDQALERFGLAVQGMIRERIVRGIDPELTEATKRRKQEITGGSKETPLILWGQLLSSILHEVKER